MRRREGSGAKELRGVGSSRRARRFRRAGPEKVEGLVRLVMRRVLEAGEGETREGTFQRSMDVGRVLSGFVAASVGDAGGEEEAMVFAVII